MKTFYLIRHAHSEANGGGISRPDRLIALSQTGRRQAEKLARLLPEPAAIFCSQLARTAETAAPYAEKWRQIPQILPQLNEFSCLAYEDVIGLDGTQRRPLADAFWQQADPKRRTVASEFTLPDSFADFSQRVAAFRRLCDSLPDQSVCFTHGIWLAMLIWQLLGFGCETSADMRRFRSWQQKTPMPNTAAFALHTASDGWAAIRFAPQFCADKV
ncbi:MAG: histidine phosphatase family protein [Neisseria sp.]|nr:histidine phosphatase family protein [Neisseria sp.]